MENIIYNKGWNLVSFTENKTLNEIRIYFQNKYIEGSLYSYNNTIGYENVIDNVEINKGYWIKLSEEVILAESGVLFSTFPNPISYTLENFINEAKLNDFIDINTPSNTIDGSGLKILICDEVFSPNYINNYTSIVEGINYTNYTTESSNGTSSDPITHGDNSFRTVYNFAPNAQYYFAATEVGSFESTEELDNLIQSFQWAIDEGVDLITISLSYSSDGMENPTTEEQIAVLKELLKTKIQAMPNTIICASAGNSPNSLLVLPSDINEPNFISVGLASSPDYFVVEHDTSFEKPDLVMPQIIDTGAWIGYDQYNFTSKTSPLVCGLMAIAKLLKPELPAVELINLVYDTASMEGIRDDDYGFGVPLIHNIIDFEQLYINFPLNEDGIIVFPDTPLTKAIINIQSKIQKNSGLYYSIGSSGIPGINAWGGLMSVYLINTPIVGIYSDVVVDDNDVYIYSDLNTLPEINYVCELYRTQQIHTLNGMQIVTNFTFADTVKGLNLYSFALDETVQLSNYSIKELSIKNIENDEYISLIKANDYSNYINQSIQNIENFPILPWSASTLLNTKIINNSMLPDPYELPLIDPPTGVIKYKVAFHINVPVGFPEWTDTFNDNLVEQIKILNERYSTTGESMRPVDNDYYTEGGKDMKIQFELLTNENSQHGNNYYTLESWPADSSNLGGGDLYFNGLVESQIIKTSDGKYGNLVEGDTINIFCSPYESSASAYAYTMDISAGTRFWSTYHSLEAIYGFYTVPNPNTWPYSDTFGRIPIHEIGHLLNLQHTFGTHNNIPNPTPTEMSDYINDTPRHLLNNAVLDGYFLDSQGNPLPTNDSSIPDTITEDPGRDPVYNYMNYSPTVNWNRFTDNQLNRMWSAISTYQPEVWALGNPVLAKSKKNKIYKYKKINNLKTFNYLQKHSKSHGGFCNCKHIDNNAFNNTKDKYDIDNYIFQKRNELVNLKTKKLNNKK